MSTLELYNRFRTVPEEAKKTIKGGKLNGFTDINPMWRIKKLTKSLANVDLVGTTMRWRDGKNRADRRWRYSLRYTCLLRGMTTGLLLLWESEVAKWCNSLKGER